MKRLILVAATAATAAAALPASAGAHATISPLAPQGPALTSARTEYVVRAPNETTGMRTARLTMFVPEAVQQGISTTLLTDWTVRLTRVPTGQKDEDGNPVMKTTRIQWTARPGAAFGPGFYGRWLVRFQNPATPQKLCFPMHQYYRGKRVKGKRTKTETVYWTGSEGSEHPASCVNVVASA